MTSAGGDRHTHLFRINKAPLAAANNWKMEKGDTNRDTAYWMNADGTTGEGDSFLTIDMVCAACHPTKSVAELPAAASSIHDFAPVDVPALSPAALAGFAAVLAGGAVGLVRRHWGACQ